MAKISVKARAVDLLGRQQIAGIPTAIHELFKNAHDAYAQNVEVDYFRKDGTFMLRDDGYGMTREEFEGKWLTIGTESKVNANTPESPAYTPKGFTRRVILGEKGIGRLAIATIGRQALILTRAERRNKSHNLVASFVHWGLFEIPGVDLSAIDIPVVTLRQGEVPDESVVSNLKREIIGNIREIGTAISKAEAERIIEDLNAFTIDPKLVAQELGGLTLTGGNTGTHFYIMPTDPILEQDIDETGSEDIAAPLQKMLLGFSNSMMPEESPPSISTAFRDHRIDGTVVDLIGENEFFTPEEFKSADHHFDGEIDEYGQLRGTISIYRNEPVPCSFSWHEARGQKTACGPFRIKFAYVQGDPRETLLPTEEYARIISKLNKIGGLYIYQDGNRILPYGNSDYDFLNIERRRTKSAQDWFFSYRRIFGAIQLTRKSNPELKEKAGREGFIANLAYRQLRSIAEHVFMQLAKTYFRPSADLGDDFNRIKLDLKHQDSLLKKREKRIRQRKQKFEEKLTEYFLELQDGIPHKTIESLKLKVEQKIAAISAVEDSKTFADELLGLETRTLGEFSDLEQRFVLTKPRGFSVSKKTQARWYAYLDESERLEKELFKPFLKWLDKEITKCAGGRSKALGRRKRAREALEETKSQTIKFARAISREALSEASDLLEEVRKDARESLSTVNQAIENTLIEFESTDTTSRSDSEIKALQRTCQKRIKSIAKEETSRIEAIISQIHAMSEAMAAGDSLSDEQAALEAGYIGLREQLDLYSDLAQVGTALGIVQHEFSATVRSVRESIHRLSSWATLDEELDHVYNDIRASFEHLDGYLGMFTPLNRRLHRSRIPIVGEEIRRYLQHVFGDRLARHEIKLSASREFDTKIVEAYPSTYYPAFLNLVDNAIFWISSRDGGTREIVLDANESSFSVSNSGPGIPVDLKDWIFEFAHTEKDGGRGMGLYISKQTLEKEGADLVLENPGKNHSPVFRILLPAETD